MSANGDGVTIPTRVDASGVGPGVQQTADGLAKIETATKSAAAAAQQAGAATAAAAAQQAAAAAQAGEASDKAATQTANLGTLSQKTALALSQMGIAEATVATSAVRVGASLEVTARALIGIAQSRASDEIARVRAQLEMVSDASAETAETQTAGTDAATKSTQDYDESLSLLGDRLETDHDHSKNLIDELGKMRESRRIAIELFETMQGGGDTVAGLTGLMRTLVLTMDMNPYLLAFSAVALALSGLIAKHEDHAKAAGDDADKTNTLADALERAKQAAKDIFPDDYIDSLSKQSREMEASADAAQKLLHAQQELRDAQTDQKLAQLDEYEDIDLEGKNADQQLAIKQDYAQRRLKLEQQLARDKAAADVEGAQAGVDKAQSNLATNRAAAAALVQDILGPAYAIVNGGAASALRASGVKSDADTAQDRLNALQALQSQRDGNGQMRGLTSQEAIEYDQLKRDLPGLQAREHQQGPSFAGVTAKLQAELKKSQDDLDYWTDPGRLENHWNAATGGQSPEARAQQDMDQISAITAQITAINKYKANTDEASKQIHDNVPKFQELNDAVPALTDEVKTAQTQLATFTQKLKTLTDNTQPGEQTKLNTAERNQYIERQLENRESARKQQTDDLDAQIADTADEAMKKVLERQKTDIEATGIEDKAQTDYNTGKTGLAQLQEEKRLAADLRTGADAGVNRENQQREVDAAKATIEGSGNKETIRQMHELVQRDQGDMSKLLTDLLALMSQHITAQTQANLAMSSRLKAVESAQRQHKRSAQSLSNGGGYQ